MAWLALESNGLWSQVPLFLIGYSAYWTLFHRLTSRFQAHSKIDEVGKIMGARALVINFILASGEALTGKIAQFLSVSEDLFVRASICLLALFVVVIAGRRIAT
jgi:hypothetical protein